MWVWDTEKNYLQVIKQSHVILNFLGMEGKLTNSQIEAIWQSAQLKHCSKQVHTFM
jgi:ubiquitin carboxyl-terminal hydrolase 34